MKRIILTVLAFLTALSAGLPVSAEMPLGSFGYSGEDAKTVLRQKTEYNRAYWTLFSLIASSAAYAPKDGIETVYLRSHGWEFAPNRITDGKTTVHFITGKGVMAGGKPLYVISFRGSADKKDWAADFVTGQVVYGGKTLEESEKIAGFLPGGDRERDAAEAAAEKAGASVPPKVHKGFNSYADLTLRMLLTSGSYEFLEQYRKEKDARLLLTGHSLGGAVATIVGQRLIDFGFDPDRLQVITFGAPAVGNKAFKQMYGDRLELIRVTNSEDPVPLTLQAVLRNYRQFGEEVRFRIPRTLNNMNHFLHIYLDAGLKNYYSALDASVKKGVIQKEPDEQHVAVDKPEVLLYVESSGQEKKSRNSDVKTAMELLERFILNEYRNLFPNYIVVRSPLDPYEAMNTHGADYLLQVKFDAVTNQYNNNWFLTVEQTLSDKNGNVLSSCSVSRRTSPLAGNILAAMEVISAQKAELLRKMSWLRDERNN
jgi:hypothetical protein